MQKEGSLDAFAIADAAHREHLAAGSILAGDHDAFVRLDAALVIFLNTDENPDRVADAKLGAIGF